MATVKARTERRKATVRRAIKEAATGRARLSVLRSSKHIYAQVIDDAEGRDGCRGVVAGEGHARSKTGANVDAAKAVGKLVAQRAVEKGVKERRVRSRRLSLPRAHQGARRRRARGRLEVLNG